ncbi:polymer-forming cytoskeletal protein [Terrilactibacillus sp. S3-3]|nr:polymer-forming cytoskeletal protein [Terrilactibacillus sp. S3-3]
MKICKSEGSIKMETEKMDLTISGSGSAPGGQYDQVHVNGSGKIVGDIECQILDINGSGKVIGQLHADAVSINGSGKVEGSIQAESVTINGHSTITGEVAAGFLKIDGMAKIGGNVKGDTVALHGTMKIEGSCEAETVTVQGGLSIDELLSADKIDITLYNTGTVSYIKEIGGGTIQVKRTTLTNVVGRLLKAFFKRELSAETIEGDDIFS